MMQLLEQGCGEQKLGVNSIILHEHYGKINFAFRSFHSDLTSGGRYIFSATPQAHRINKHSHSNDVATCQFTFKVKQ